LSRTGSSSGAFATINLPVLTGGRAWNTSLLYTTGQISVLLAGDYNGNGIVDAADYVVWRHSLGQVVAQYTGTDGNGNGAIDTGDYDLWRTAFSFSTVAYVPTLNPLQHRIWKQFRFATDLAILLTKCGS
jgi:hypothetical protein